jgi:hypothetical protein
MAHGRSFTSGDLLIKLTWSHGSVAAGFGPQAEIIEQIGLNSDQPV